ncbi:ATP-binding protein [Brachybacterium sp. AOP29-B2-41]|uniref:ATP-binding protein n=1 Tax=Brachybacterium sp. AOP29-B2-41 TaxID=3457704 RepID=UPI0040342318
MIGDYESITNFVKSEIVHPQLQYNALSTTTSAILRITRGFESLGWKVEQSATEKGANPRHALSSPDGNVSLSMNGAKVFRHPIHTEQICQRKHLTKRMLEFSGVPAPRGGDFSARELNAARAFFRMLPRPVVVKPTNAGGSHGVSVGVNDEEDFERAWHFALAEGGQTGGVLIEQFVRGVELRAFVVGDNVPSVVARIQPYVLGDGMGNISELMLRAEEDRSVHYRSVQLPVVKDWSFIEKQGFYADSVPGAGEVVYINPLGLPVNGAMLVDVTGRVSDGVKQLAVKAKSSIPDLEIGGVDILVEDVRDSRGAVVLEVNTAPSLNLHRYATHGSPREVCSDIIDYFHNVYLEQALRVQ